MTKHQRIKKLSGEAMYSLLDFLTQCHFSNLSIGSLPDNVGIHINICILLGMNIHCYNLFYICTLA